jgi:membrane protein required for colicin V production
VINGVDAGILGVVGLSVITGLMRGFVKESIALCVWVIAIWLAYNHAYPIENILQPYIADKTARTVSAFFIVLLGVLLVGGIFNALFGFFLKRSGLSGTDRMLGMGFGFARGVLIVAFLIAVVNATSIPQEPYVIRSSLYPSFTPIVSWLKGKMPDLMQKIGILEQSPLIETETADSKETSNTSLS